VPTGSNAVLYAARSVSPYFTPDLAGEYRIRLEVTDPAPVALTSTDHVTVTAEACNQQPVAVIFGESNVCSIPAPVDLSGENSFDPDGEIVEYKWEILKEVDSREILDHEKCIKQLALNVDKNVKYPLNQQKANQFIVEIVMQKEDQRDFNSLR